MVDIGRGATFPKAAHISQPRMRTLCIDALPEIPFQSQPRPEDSLR
jgi:hypothetical protein